MLAPTGVVLALVPAIPPDLAVRGTLFVDFTAPHTPGGPALATLLTGRDVFAHGVLDDDSAPPDPTAPQLPDLAADRGVEVVGPSADALRHLTELLAQDRPFLLIAEGAATSLELPPHVLLFAVAESQCLLVWPGRVPAGRRVRAAVRSLDVAPTVLDALGLADVAVEQWLPGASLLSLAEAPDPRPTYRELYLTDGRHGRGWRTPEWVLWESPGGTTLARKTNQLEDLAQAHPEVVAELRRRMLGHTRRRAAETGHFQILESGLAAGVSSARKPPSEERMSEQAQGQVTITIRENGPYRVEGPLTLRDWNGNEITLRNPPYSLCRCGGSTNKPFCDGTHSKIGFQGAMQAVEQAEQNKPQ